MTKTKNFTEMFSLVYPSIKDFTSFGMWVRKRMGDSTVIGINCHASSFIRKQETLRRIKEEIEKQNLPIKINDVNEYGSNFQLLINE